MTTNHRLRESKMSQKPKQAKTNKKSRLQQNKSQMETGLKLLKQIGIRGNITLFQYLYF